MYSTPSRWTSLFLLVPLLLVAACGAPEEEEEAMGGMEEAEAPAETAPGEETMEAPGAVTVALEPLNESGVTGSATATHQNDSVAVEVQVQNVSATGELPAHIHEGDCATGGPVLVPLNSVTVSDGSGSSTTTLGADQVPEGQAAYVQVHAPEGQPLACGNLQGHGSGM